MGRIAEGGEVLAPGEPERPFAAVDVRDLAGWILDALDRGLNGAYTALAPAGRDTWGDWFNSIRDVTGSDVNFTWVDDDFLVAQGVTPWSGLPLWLPGGARGLRTDKIESVGFSARPLVETVHASWEWLRSLSEPPEALYRPTAMDRATETRLLAAYAARP
jgi:2'-hydroxyisoflavone reductase